MLSAVLLALVATVTASGPLLSNPEYFASEADALEALRVAAASAADAPQEAAGTTPSDTAAADAATGSEELKFAMNRGWWKLAEELVATYRTRKVDLTNTLYTTASAIRRKIQLLQDGLRSRSTGKR